MRYAVNLADLMYPERRLMTRLLIAPVRGETIYISSRRIDEVAVELACPEERAKAIMAIICTKCRWVRFYRAKGRGWRKIPKHVLGELLSACKAEIAAG